MKTTFKEEQKFTQWWIWLFLIVIGVLPVFGIYKQLILGQKFGDNPMPDEGLIAFTILTFLFIIFFAVMRLETEIDQKEIRIHFFPLVKKRYHWNEVKSAEVINYGFVGGYGIRLWTKFGTVYNTKGNKGLAIVFSNRKKILIGTQKEKELAEFITGINQENFK